MDRRLKIGFFMDSFRDFRSGAGTENQVRGLLSHLDPEAVETSLYTFRDGPASKSYPDFPCPSFDLDIRTVKSWDGLRRFAGLVRLLRRERFDLAMIYFPDASVVMPPACRLAGVRSVVNRRDMGYWHTGATLRQTRFANRFTDYCLANAGAIGRRVARHEGLARDRVTVIPNGLYRDPPAETARPTDFGLPDDRPLIGMVANLRPVKRFDRFLGAAARLCAEGCPADWVIVGTGPLEDDLKARAADMGLADRVHFTGGVSEVLPLMSLFRVGVLTSESEGLSNSLIELAAAGTPAVAFDVGGNADVIVEGETGHIVPNGDVDALAARIGGLIGDTARHAAYAAAGRERVARLHAPAAVASRHVDFFREAVGR